MGRTNTTHNLNISVAKTKSYLCIIPLLCKYSRAQTISAE